MAEMASKVDFQINFRCEGKYVLKKGQTFYFEAKCAKYRFV